MSTQNQPHDDLAVAERLRRLAELPVDTSRLDQAIEARIYGNADTRSFRIAAWLRPMRAVAASVVLMAVVATLLLVTSSGPVLASPTEMARFHEDLVSGKVPVMAVTSMHAAEKAIARQWKESPQLPGVPEDHAMACCMRSVKNKKMACVLLKDDGEPVTMTVAKADDMQLPQGEIRTRNSTSYHVQSVNDLNMVMTERDGRWVCLISKISVDRLMELAAGLQF
jgi:hypothetical protein